MSIYISESLISSVLDLEHKICLYHYECYWRRGSTDFSSPPYDLDAVFYQNSFFACHKHVIMICI